MRRAVILGITLTALVISSSPATAEICTIDHVPAATLLLPYFELDLGDVWGVATLFSINNASAAPALAHVTVWTDMSIPTLDFDVYLTGYDVQTINLRDIFNGVLPVTADANSDPGDLISPRGALSQDLSFPGTTGPCVGPYRNPVLDDFRLTNLRLAHTGQNAPAYGGCLAASYGDNIARGYITIDLVTQCNLLFPSSAGYFSTGIADTDNILWGDYFIVEEAENFAQGEMLVHVESCPVPSVGTGAGSCPFTVADYTFYGRYAPVAGKDQREPLATTFAARFINGSAFDSGTTLIVWRDAKTIPTGVNGPFPCDAAEGPAWFPLNQADVVGFSEWEDSEDLCFTGDVVSPPIGGAQTCFPLEAQRVSLIEPYYNVAAALIPSPDFGWLYLNLNHTLGAGAGTDPFPGVAQAWVTTLMSAEVRFGIGYDAVRLDSACATPPGGLVLTP